MNNGKITYVGWLEGQNLGDNALYLSNQMVFHPYELVPDDRRRGNQWSRITIFGGGTIIPFVTFWTRPNLYNYAFGVGVEVPEFYPEFFPEEAIRKAKKLNFRLLGVRGEMSKELLRSWGIDSEVVGDPALLLEPAYYSKKKDDLVVLNISSTNRIWGHDHTRILEETRRLCEALQREYYRVVLVPFCTEDVSVTRKLSEMANVDIFDEWANIQATINFIASSRVVIGERLHCNIFSAASYTPFIMIAYRPKCFDFVNTVGFSKYAIRTDELTGRKTFNLFQDLIKNWDSMHYKLVENVGKNRKRLREFAQRIKNDVERLPEGKWSTPNSLATFKWRVFNQTDRILHYQAYKIWRSWHRLKLVRTPNS